MSMKELCVLAREKIAEIELSIDDSLELIDALLENDESDELFELKENLERLRGLL
ncbi:hypothetical protein [Campylobacter sp. CCS1377]|uniref:Phage protein n=1 Tax=Campylobacter sp. CCS1377 TaxID=3158229 RepID=A0AAU7E5F9_9BACT